MDSARVPLPPSVAAGRDTTAARRDSVKAPIAPAERPRSPEAAPLRTVWNREDIFRTGAVTLPDLLALVPGVTVGQAAFIAAPAVASWYGQPGRVRVYVDGLEVDDLDPRNAGVADLSQYPLWAMEEVAVERAAGELRVFLRSWRVQLTTPQTRTDVYSGSENSNLYRGFYGKRYHNGAVLQVAAQQYSTTNFTTRGDGDALSAFGRVGVAREAWGVDIVAIRSGQNRGPTRRFVRSAPVDVAIPAFSGHDLMAYLRATWRSPDREGLWGQILAGTLRYVESDSSAANATSPDLDTTNVRAQYVAALGYTRGGLRLSGTARLRAGLGASQVAPALRASYETAGYQVSGFAEVGGPDSTLRLDVVGRLRVTPWLFVGMAHSQHDPRVDSAASRVTSRAELAFTWRERWLTMGVVRRGEARVDGLRLFDADFGPADLAPATGLELGLSGRLWGPFSMQWRGVTWGEEALYRSSVESRTEIRVETALEKRLPKAKFHLMASVTHDYRNDFLAPDGSGGVIRGRSANALGSLLDLRIGSAHVFFYNRNMTGSVYETIPGYLMPRLVQFYGIRWEFWN